MKQFIIETGKKYGEIIRYLVVGFSNTGLNVLLFWFLNSVLSVNYLISNAIAWCVCVVIVFMANKYYVFRQSQGGLAKMGAEAVMFFALRGLSGLLDMLLLYLFVGVLAWNTMVGKISDIIIIVVVNYLTTKFIVFRKTTNNS
jgi:putative flippase GtrA